MSVWVVRVTTWDDGTHLTVPPQWLHGKRFWRSLKGVRKLTPTWNSFPSTKICLSAWHWRLSYIHALSGLFLRPINSGMSWSCLFVRLRLTGLLFSVLDCHHYRPLWGLRVGVTCSSSSLEAFVFYQNEFCCGTGDRDATVKWIFCVRVQSPVKHVRELRCLCVPVFCHHSSSKALLRFLCSSGWKSAFSIHPKCIHS